MEDQEKKVNDLVIDLDPDPQSGTRHPPHLERLKKTMKKVDFSYY